MNHEALTNWDAPIWGGAMRPPSKTGPFWSWNSCSPVHGIFIRDWNFYHATTHNLRIYEILGSCLQLESQSCVNGKSLVQSDTADAQNRSWDAMGHNTASYLLEATGKGTKASSAMRVVCWENIWRDNFDFSVQIEKKGRAKSVLHQTNNPGLESGNLGTCIYRAGNAWES